MSPEKGKPGFLLSGSRSWALQPVRRAVVSRTSTPSISVLILCTFLLSRWQEGRAAPAGGPGGEPPAGGHDLQAADGGVVLILATDAIAVALEEPGNAHPLGMIASEAGVDPIDLLERVGEPRGRQFIRSEPPAEIGERSCNGRKSDADQCESCQRAGRAEARPQGFCWCFEVVRHPLLHSN